MRRDVFCTCWAKPVAFNAVIFSYTTNNYSQQVGLPLVSQSVSQSISPSVTESDPKCFFGPKLRIHVVDYRGRSCATIGASELLCCRRTVHDLKSVHLWKMAPTIPFAKPEPTQQISVVAANEGKSSIPIIDCEGTAAATGCCSYDLGSCT